ncbi:uroporphyrinogen-III C-methyltransferase [Porticoccus sp. W117]|uniref:uroporphyrinogen-III C-methyltransferase n=1 Tax=Porticoccus sp. W117 TaxID=3054777 RepID=UPI002592B6C5|nr:uroporphyrinogen-III C-methyltransferase [Porticoccus sp. W117]MDM3871738.1 uroporphyrinogen-III C-methyltransferase [Porticoccus sp. W117]
MTDKDHKTPDTPKKEDSEKGGPEQPAADNSQQPPTLTKRAEQPSDEKKDKSSARKAAADKKTSTSKPQHLPEPLDIEDLSTDRRSVGKKSAGKKASARKSRRSTRNRRSAWPALLVTVLLLAGIGAGGYYGWLYLQDWQTTGNSQQQALQARLDQQAQQLQQLQQQLQQQQNSTELDSLAARLQQADQVDQANRQQLDELQRRVTSQGSRLRNLSVSTRDDWLLAEAEYLLRLANQRLLTERSTANPVSLLQTADAILKDFDDPDLFAVRSQIAKDITALKIATIVDREGLYLQLNALNETIPELTLALDLKEQIPQAAPSQTVDSEQSWGDRVAGHFSDFANGMKDYVRIRQRDEPVEPLLGVEEQYLRHNLRVMMEQAQLALLREEPQLYRASLEKCRQWLQQHFAKDHTSQVFGEQLDTLSTQIVTSQLPEISASLQALRNYINLWHLRHEQPTAGAEAGDQQ